MAAWCSIFCATDKRNGVIAAFHEWFDKRGFTRYNPFDIIPGASYPITFKAFVSPTAEGTGGSWMRIILNERNDDFLEGFQLFFPASHMLDIADFSGTTPDAESAAIGGIDVTTLPGDVQSMADKIDLKGAGKLANRLIGNLGGKLGASDADAAAARAMLAKTDIDWANGAGLALKQKAEALGLPPNWRSPDFMTLRDAYSVHKRLERSPNAKLYEGDADSRDAVPDALAYTPIFAGKYA